MYKTKSMQEGEQQEIPTIQTTCASSSHLKNPSEFDIREACERLRTPRRSSKTSTIPETPIPFSHVGRTSTHSDISMPATEGNQMLGFRSPDSLRRESSLPMPINAWEDHHNNIMLVTTMETLIDTLGNDIAIITLGLYNKLNELEQNQYSWNNFIKRMCCCCCVPFFNQEKKNLVSHGSILETRRKSTMAIKTDPDTSQAMNAFKFGATRTSGSESGKEGSSSRP